ncbi:MAG: hypothetical protein ACPIA8_03305 [Candidatus Puniceispirillaceae bacterium]
MVEVGANGKAKNSEALTPYNLARDNSKLIGTDALQILDQARY